MTAGIPLPQEMRWRERMGRTGAIGFGAGLGLTGFVTAALSGPGNADPLIGTVFYTLTGLVAGLLLGSASRERKHALGFALSGAIGFGGGFYAVAYLLAHLNWNLLGDYLHGNWFALAYVAGQFVVIGLLTGILMGATEGMFAQAGRAGLAAAVGFAVGAMLQFVAYGLLTYSMLVPIAEYIAPDGALNTVMTVIGWGLTSALVGAIGGATLGEALA